MKMKKIILITLVLLTVTLFGSCGNKNETDPKASYTSITSEQAKQIMDKETNYVILDVRTEEEFNQEHIPNAILIPDYEIKEKSEEVLTDKDQLILVYCRSGNRSKEASQTLAQSGYTNVKEFGGINDWPYETAGDYI